MCPPSLPPSSQEQTEELDAQRKSCFMVGQRSQVHDIHFEVQSLVPRSLRRTSQHIRSVDGEKHQRLRARQIRELEPREVTRFTGCWYTTIRLFKAHDPDGTRRGSPGLRPQILLTWSHLAADRSQAPRRRLASKTLADGTISLTHAHNVEPRASR